MNIIMGQDIRLLLDVALDLVSEYPYRHYNSEAPSATLTMPCDRRSPRTGRHLALSEFGDVAEKVCRQRATPVADGLSDSTRNVM